MKVFIGLGLHSVELMCALCAQYRHCGVCLLCRRILHLADRICGGWATPGATGLARVLWSKSASCGETIFTVG